MSTNNPGWAAWRHNFDAALTQAFLTLLWTDHCNGTAEHADPAACRGQDCDAGLDYLGYEPDDFAPGAAREIEEDLQGFVTSCLAERPECFNAEPYLSDPGQVGYDFILTRNGHGVGFWDRGLPYDLGDWLTAMAKPFGPQGAYVSGDLIYVHG